MIEPVLNGFVCIVGCQRVVFPSRHAMLDAINAYYERPEETEKQFIEQAVNKPYGPNDCPQPCAPNGMDGARCEERPQAPAPRPTLTEAMGRRQL